MVTDPHFIISQTRESFLSCSKLKQSQSLVFHFPSWRELKSSLGRVAEVAFPQAHRPERSRIFQALIGGGFIQRTSSECN